MTLPVQTNPFADDDIFSYIQYYSDRSVTLGEQLWDEIRGAFKLHYIEVMALAHTSRKPNYWRGRFN